MTKSRPKKNQSECTDLPQDTLPCNNNNNIYLLKRESSQIIKPIFFTLSSRLLSYSNSGQTDAVHRTSAIFVTNPDKHLASRNVISDIRDHFSQFCITTIMKDKLQQVKNIKILFKILH